METPKSSSSFRINSSGAAPRISPQSIAASSESSKKHSPRAVRQLKTSPRYSEPTISSSKLAAKAPKERSPAVSDHKSPVSPLSEKKRPNKVAELESQISQLENEVKGVKDQLSSSQTSEEQAKKEAEESNQQLLILSSKLQELEKKLLEQSASHDARAVDTPNEQDKMLQAELEALRKQQLRESASLASALDEIERVKAQLVVVAKSEADQISHSDSARTELLEVKGNLVETCTAMEEMKKQLNGCKESEAQAQELVSETLMQLNAAKKMVEMLRLDGCKATEAYEAAADELEESRARVRVLEEAVGKLKCEVEEREGKELNETDFDSLRLEVEQLRSALEVAEIREKEERTQSGEEVKHAREMVEEIKGESGRREAELEAELRKSSYEIEQLKSNLMDKETELQGMFEENDELIMQLENAVSGHGLKAEIESMKARLCEKEIHIQNVSDENKLLKLEMKERSEALSEVEAARAAEREVLMKVGYMTEEVEKSNRKAARVAEQLEAAQAANAEMEAELRRMKVQSDQWRKAAEVAASMFTVGNNGQAVERTGSMDSNYSPRVRRVASPYADDLDDDLMKKKNVNVLRRFGVLWKKPQK